MRLEDEIKQKQFRNEHHKATVNIIYTFNWLNNQLTTSLKEYHITPQQYNILRILRGQYPQPASVNLLKERMLDKMSDASRLVERLKQKKLVTRKENEKDRRQVDVLITEKGLHLLKVMDKLNSKADKAMNKLDEKEAEKLNELLDKLRG